MHDEEDAQTDQVYAVDSPVATRSWSMPAMMTTAGRRNAAGMTHPGVASAQLVN